MGAVVWSWLSGAATVALVASIGDSYGQPFGHHEDTMILFAFEAVAFLGAAIYSARQ